MKFMQRAAAAATAAPPSSPGVSQQSEDERPSKRVKTEFGGASSSSSPRTPQAQKPLFDHQAAAQAALDAEDEKREALAARLAERLGDAHWRLDPARLPGSDRRKGVPLNIVQVGFSQIDRSDALATTTRPTETDEPVLQSYQPKQITKTEVRVPAHHDRTISLICFYRMMAQIAILTPTPTLTLILTLALTHRALLLVKPPSR